MPVQDKLHALMTGASHDVCGYEGTTSADRSPLRFLYNACNRLMKKQPDRNLPRKLTAIE
jgi:hypothetical protein